MEPRRFLTELFETAVTAADPMKALEGALPARPKGRTVVVALGKGAAQLAAAFETLWSDPVEGVVVTRYGYAAPCRHLPVLEASHPVPDAAGLEASAAVMRAVSGLTADDLVVALVCGGGSALLPAPPEGLTLADEQALNRALLASGAPIGVMNAIRKHVSRIKGGRLAALAHPARVVSLVVSDVPGDDPAQVASGPTVPDRVDRAQALAMIDARKIVLPEAIMRHISSDASAAPLPDDPRFAGNEVKVIASARLSLEAAAARAEAQGVPAVILSDAIEGEAHDVGRVHAAIAREVALRGRPFRAPVVVLSGGETTVTLGTDPGRGGRNTAFLMGLAEGIEDLPGITALAADTDGIDGTEDNAGAFADGGTFGRLRARGEDPRGFVRRQDPYGAFSLLGDIYAPGPTGTNVNDFRAILIDPQA
ncbi:glycerate kinase type-2 family protein [Maliponia aquimaris]|uniref:Putative hydroxypyruvate reductase n=1 Tax=Maliponia aquimaris TaxID=1673631 RepID=A0A238KPV4_9RHOB|nr:glycerate kinase [Maliponia aquimaris]SMX44853.1 Putative hydroxypyruvate reductase [Maliponia aquimaris]